MREVGQNQLLGEDKGFVGPVIVAVTTVHLVREAEIQLRRPRLRLMPLGIRTHSVGERSNFKNFLRSRNIYLRDA